MTTLELIGTFVGLVATILVGVWFIISKSFGLGRFSHRLEEIDKRTANASCETHRKEIADTKDSIREIKTDMMVIKSLLAMKHKEAASIFSIKNSPRQLNDTGNRLFDEIKGMDFLKTNKDTLFAQIDSYEPKTALDVENAAHEACISCVDKDMFNGFKNYIYNSPSLKIKDEKGEERSYDLSIPDVCFVLSLPLRDMYLQAHPSLLAQ